MKPQAKRVDFSDPVDVHVAVLGMLGWSNNGIRKIAPDYSNGMIGYRIKKAGAQRRLYRDGVSAISQSVAKKFHRAATEEVNSATAHLRTG